MIMTEENRSNTTLLLFLNAYEIWIVENAHASCVFNTITVARRHELIIIYYGITVWYGMTIYESIFMTRTKLNFVRFKRK